MSEQKNNPFRVSGTVDNEYFTDRGTELRRIRAALRQPGAKLLVYGHRRMGKSSAVERAVRQTTGMKGHAFAADLSTASTVVDMANRVMEAATRTLGRRWREVASDLVGRVGGTLKLTTDPRTGMVVPSFEVALRRADVEDQRASLGRVLDAVNEMARARGVTIGIALDEFQEIARFGGEDAEWHLRGVIQHHQHVSYVLAGSKPHLIRRMLEKGRAFYDMLEVLHFGPMDSAHLSRWIEERMAKAGVGAGGVGPRVVEVAGPRTRDVVQLALKTYDLTSGAGVAHPSDVDTAFRELVEDRDDLARTFWGELTANQQNVLRAVAVQPAGLTTADAIERFGLSSSSAVTQALAAFVEEGRLVRDDPEPGYTFDSPFLRGWVIVNALPDLGIALPATHRPSTG
jgi:AAA+ ATPase superfamily predicted ATPase